jgi:uncharacterized protein (TIGR02145 family)
MKHNKYIHILLSLSITIIIYTSCKKDNNEPPEKPFLKYPSNNSVLDTVPLKLDWDCYDFDSEKLTYDLYYGSTNSPELIASDIDTSEYTDFEVESEQIYYWKVIAKDEHGNHTEGDLWTFTTGNFPPETPTNPIPEDNSTDQTPVEITWECIEPEGEALTYDIYFGTDDTPELIAEDHTDNSYQLLQLIGNQKYYWRIVAKDIHDREINGPLWNFTTGLIAPTLLFPDDNAVNAPWYPVLKWSCENTESISFDLYLGTSSDPPLIAGDITDLYYGSERLTNDETYYWKVVAKGQGGSEAESPVWSFTVFGNPIFDSFTDARDGNTYKTVTIGNQTWMAENLKYFVDGSKLLDDEPLNEDIYGRLYTWEQVMNGEEASNENPSGVQGIAPDGWHIPSDTEWFELLYFLGATFDDYAYFQDVTDKLREAGSEHWGEGNTATNESGFTALPGGYFDIDQNVFFNGTACLHTCSKAYSNWGIYFAIYPFVVQRWYDMNRYNSLRCVKD